MLITKIKAIEIIEKSSGKLVERFTCKNKSQSMMEKIKRGVEINLNHDKYRVVIGEEDRYV